MRLEVSKTKQTISRSTEATFEKKFAAALLRRGIFSWHTAEKFIKGIPDRYVTKGNWIEFKAIPYAGTRSITPERFLKPEQKLWLTKLHEAGDRTFVCILFQPATGKPKALICPWITLRGQGAMPVRVIDEHAQRVPNDEAMDIFVGTRFDKNYDGWSNYELRLSC